MQRRLIVIVMLALNCLPLLAQEAEAEKTVAAWFRGNTRAAPYESIRDDLKSIIVLGNSARLPAALLTEIFDEAVSKAVPPAQLLAALKGRTDDLIRLAESLDRSRECLAQGPGGGADDRSALLPNFAPLLRRGIALDNIESVLHDACQRHKNFTAALDALRTLANIPSLGELPNEKIGALGSAILGSNLSPSGYTALSSIYIKGKLKNINTRDITDIILSVLKEGKGLIRIEQELNRHGGQ